MSTIRKTKTRKDNILIISPSFRSLFNFEGIGGNKGCGFAGNKHVMRNLR